MSLELQVPEDICYWEVVYKNSSILRESEGATYKDINRDDFDKFRLVYKSQVVFETWPPEGATGHNFVFRRRTGITHDAERDVIFILGWEPHGPAYVVDLLRGTYRMNESGFSVSDSELYPPQSMLGEYRYAQFLKDIRK